MTQVVEIADERDEPFDLTRLQVIGPFLRWKHARTALQLPLLAVAALILYDGLFGPQLAPKNMAGVLPWVHWRGLIVLALLIAGNLFCMACPFMLPRRLAKKLLPANRSWPTIIRSKWLAVGLLGFFFWSYEAFDLWASPWLTAWVAAAYFAAAFVIDGFFKGAAFCKYVCPIGQFNFVNSLVSPFEVKVREHSVCASCTTKDCIRGRYEPVPLQIVTRPEQAAPRRLVQQGCETWLFQQRKVGNLDCTFCLDCVQACPHDNVGVLGRIPGQELIADPRRSSIGRFSERPDIAALVLVMVFGAFLNAFGMVGPIYSFEAWIAQTLNTRSEPLVLAVLFVAGLIIVPATLTGSAAWLSNALAQNGTSLVSTATRYSFALVPIGFGMWLAHYGYHFLTGALTVVPLTQSFLSDIGFTFLEEPRWDLAAIVPGWSLDLIELTFLEVGTITSLVVAFQIARTHSVRPWLAWIPWATLIVLCFGAGVWLMQLPMEMRGTFGG